MFDVKLWKEWKLHCPLIKYNIRGKVETSKRVILKESYKMFLSAKKCAYFMIKYNTIVFSCFIFRSHTV